MFMVVPALEVVDSLLAGIENLIGQGPLYWLGQAVAITLGVVGVSTSSRRVNPAMLLVFFVWPMVYAAMVYQS